MPVSQKKPGRPEDARRMNPAEFADVFALAVVAGERPQELEDAAVKLEITGSDGRPIKLSDTPYNRAGFALKRRYGDDQAGFESALYRFRALMELISKGALGPWARSSIRHQGALRLHPAVLDVASSMRLSKNGSFAVTKFLKQVEATARSHYADLAEWPLDAADRDGETRR